MANSPTRKVFVAGATGYMGSRLVAELVARGHEVRALARAGSERKLPKGCIAVLGDALNSATYAEHVAPSDTWVHLVGVAHPSPAKAEQFRKIDLVSVREAVAAATKAKIQHFVYVSVARPAPVMKAYQEVRSDCERMIRDAKLNASVLRPWYVLGPGHRWPYALIPFYWLCRQIPVTRPGAERLGLVRLQEMINCLVDCVEDPIKGVRVMEPPRIREPRPENPQGWKSAAAT